jgi:hypothetical protein
MGEAVTAGDHYRTLLFSASSSFSSPAGINIASDLIVKGVKKANKA